jgi:hypothetical protein
MPRTWLGPTALLLLSLSQATVAGAASQNAPGAQTGSGEKPPPAVDVSRLPLNLQRIERQLRQSSIREERDGLNLRYIIDVFGQAPPIEIFAPQDNLLSGPAPYGGPTHNEIIQLLTPKEYRAPAADFSNLFRWLSGKSKDKSGN